MIKSFAHQYFEELKDICDLIPLDVIDVIVAALHQAYECGNQIFVMGNGGSAVTASHFVCDMNKGVSYGLEKRFKMICLNDNVASMMAYANDVSYEDIFLEQMKNFLRTGDVVIGFSGSGNSQNVVKAVRYGNEHKAITIGFTGFDGGELMKTANISLLVPINDMQKIEDIHLVLTHLIMSFFHQFLRSSMWAAFGLLIRENTLRIGAQNAIRS